MINVLIAGNRNVYKDYGITHLSYLFQFCVSKNENILYSVLLSASLKINLQFFSKGKLCTLA